MSNNNTLPVLSTLTGQELIELKSGNSWTDLYVTTQAIANLSGASSTLTINTTPTSGATAGQVLYSDGSKLQAYSVSGSGNVALTTSPSFTTPSIDSATGTSLALGGATLGGNALAVTGTTQLNGNLLFSGTTSSFPALKRSSTTLAVRLADDSADAPLSASNLALSGTVNIGGNTNPNMSNISGYMTLGGLSGGNGVALMANGTGSNSFYLAAKDSTVATHILARSTYAYGWSSTVDPTATGDTLLWRDAAGILAQVNSTNAQALRVYNTSSSSNANYERGVFGWTDTSNVLTIGTQNAGTGTARNLQFVVGGTNVLDYGISNSGAVSTGTNIDFNAGGALIARNGRVEAPGSSKFNWSGRSQMASPADGQITIWNAANTDFARLNFGGTTSSFPALKRVNTALAFRRADDTVGVFADLPAAASANEGSVYAITDGSTATWGATCAGSGANHVMVRSNGTNWTVFAA